MYFELKINLKYFLLFILVLVKIKTFIYNWIIFINKKYKLIDFIIQFDVIYDKV